LANDSMNPEIFEAIMDSVYEGVVVIDNTERVIFFNKAAAQTIGVSQSAALRRHVREIIPDIHLNEVLKAGKAPAVDKVVIKGRTLVVNRQPLRYYSRNWGAVGIFLDVSALENITGEMESYTKMVKQLNEIRKELELIIESSNDGLYTTDGTGITLGVNRTFEEMAGVKSSEVVGRHVKELVDEGFFSESVTVDVLSQDPPRPVTKIQVLRNGKYVISTGRPVFDENGKVYRVVTNIRDITHFRDFENRLAETKSQLEKYQAEATRLRSELLKEEDAVARSKAMFHVLDMVKQVAPYPTTVLVTGESGVGKEVVAKLLHTHSGRHEGPFIKVNCGAIPESLIESELFGYDPGAFTGAAKKGKPGMLELADTGTLFLDEIGELALDLQVKLLQVIQDQMVTRLGGVSTHPVNVRFIAATNRDLVDMVEQKLFREDLFYRLNVVKIDVPPLRERKDDIPALALHFLSTFCGQYKINKAISTDAMELLRNFTWPGNVRELRNVVERLVVMVTNPVILPEHLPQEIHPKPHVNQGQVTISSLVPIKDAVAEVEAQLINRAVNECGSVRKAAKVLHVAHSTLLRKMKQLGLEGKAV
jgi:PAS domain S-box-containing protein